MEGLSYGKSSMYTGTKNLGAGSSAAVHSEYMSKTSYLNQKKKIGYLTNTAFGHGGKENGKNGCSWPNDSLHRDRSFRS